MYEVEEDKPKEEENGEVIIPQEKKQPSEFMKVQRHFRQIAVNAHGKKLAKEKRIPIDYSIVLDYHNIEANNEHNKGLILDFSNLVDKSGDAGASPYYQHPSSWKVYGLKDYPGFYFIPSPFSSTQQKKWIKDAIENYANVPNNTNLNLFHGPVQDLWKHGQKELEDYQNELANQLKNKTTPDNASTQQSRPLDKNGNELPPYRTLLDKLAWATLGYQYQWTPRIYSEDFYEVFPTDLQELVQKIAIATKNDPYEAEAATINFYSEDSIMGAHLDDAEEEMEKPIVSISFGSTAVFLMGAETRDVPPVPMYIRSGDIVIMGGRSRYCYHGVAKIVEDSFNVDLVDENDETYKWHIQWLREKNRRININTRQVFKVPKQGIKSKESKIDQQ